MVAQQSNFDNTRLWGNTRLFRLYIYHALTDKKLFSFLLKRYVQSYCFICTSVYILTENFVKMLPYKIIASPALQCSNIQHYLTFIKCEPTRMHQEPTINQSELCDSG